MTDAQGLRLLVLSVELKDRAAPIGAMHSYWDVILDIDAFVRGRPTVLKKTAEEWIEYAEQLLKKPDA